MTVVPLAVLVPLLAAALLTALRPIAGRVLALALALGATVATLVLCLVLVARSGDHTIVYWWGAWRPRPDGVALGIDFAVGPLGAGMAALAAALTVAALLFASRFLETADHLFEVVLLVFL